MFSNSFISQIKKNVQYGIGNSFSILVPLLVTKRILSICGEEALGKQSIALSICLVLCIVIDYGCYVDQLKKVSVNRKFEDKLSAIFSTVFFSRIILLTLTLVIFLVLIFSIPYLNQNRTLYFYSSFIFIGQFLNPFWFYQGLEDFKNTAKFTALSKIGYIGLIFLLLQNTNDFMYVNLCFGISHTIIHGIAIWYLFRVYKIKFVKIKINDIKTYLKEDFHFLGNNLSLVSMVNVPIVFTGMFLGDFLAGIYKVLDVYLALLRNYLHVFFHSIFPRTCYNFEVSHRKGARFILKYSSLNTLFLLFIILLFIIFKSYFLTYFLKENAYLAYDYFNLIGFALVITSLNIPFQQVLFYYNKKNIYSLVYVFVSIVNIMLNYFLIQYVAIEGLIFTLFISETLITLSFIIAIEIFNKEISLFKNQINE